MGPRRGEIYFVDLGPVRGREQAGQRPVLVLSIDAINRLPLVAAVVPGTNGANVTTDHRSDVRIAPAESGLPLETVFRCFQITCVDVRKFSTPPDGRIAGLQLKRVEDAVRFVLGLG